MGGFLAKCSTEIPGGLVLGFLAYFVRSFDKTTGTWSDGLGRTLEAAPLVARFIFGTDSLWAGWGYFALEFLAFWGRNCTSQSRSEARPDLRVGSCNHTGPPGSGNRRGRDMGRSQGGALVLSQEWAAAA